LTIKHIICLIIWYFGVRYLPSTSAPGGRIFRKIRYLVCRPLFKECGINVNIERKANFGSGRRISIGNNSGIGVNAFIAGPVKIGKNVMMGPDVIMIARNHQFSRTDIPMIFQGFGDEKPIRIDDDVWLEARVILLPGVKIGSGAIIGAGAVVAKDIPDWAIVIGNPAEVIKFRKKPTV